jgi:hypothetical protein
MLNRDFRDILSAFSDAGVEYLLVGAYALAAHLEGLALPVLSRALMIANKRASDRPKDKLDLEWLEKEPAR